MHWILLPVTILVKPHRACRDKHGRRVYIYRSGKWDPDKVNFEQGFAVGYKILEMVSLEPKTQVAGITAVFDGKGFGFKQFSSVSLENQLVVINLVQQGFPLWFRQVQIPQKRSIFHNSNFILAEQVLIRRLNLLAGHSM